MIINFRGFIDFIIHIVILWIVTSTLFAWSDGEDFNLKRRTSNLYLVKSILLPALIFSFVTISIIGCIVDGFIYAINYNKLRDYARSESEITYIYAMKDVDTLKIDGYSNFLSIHIDSESQLIVMYVIENDVGGYQIKTLSTNQDNVEYFETNEYDPQLIKITFYQDHNYSSGNGLVDSFGLIYNMFDLEDEVAKIKYQFIVPEGSIISDFDIDLE